MSTSGCFSPVRQWLKNLLAESDENENTGRIIEIGPPTNFRKEEITMPFIDDDQSTLHRDDSHGVMTEKEAAQNVAVMQQASKRNLLNEKLLKLSGKLKA